MLIANTKRRRARPETIWGQRLDRSQTVKSLRTSNGFPLFGELGSLIGGTTGNALKTPTLDGCALAVMAGVRSPMKKAESNRNHCLKVVEAVWRHNLRYL